LSVSGKTREIVANFIQYLLERKFTDAERTLDTMKERNFQNDDYKKGYVNAFEGMLLSSRSGDNRDFYNKGDFTKDAMKNFQVEFKSFRNGVIRSNFDAGYFTAWSDFLQYRSNLEK
jgi:hypothetical protein